MIRLSDEVLPENRTVVNEYIDEVWQEAIRFVRSFKWEKGTEDLGAKFQSHTTAEEARLQKNLEDIKYAIDSHEVVRLISGHGRIETVWLNTHTTNYKSTDSRTDPVPDVIPCPQERFTEDQPCSQVCSGRVRASGYYGNNPVYRRGRCVSNI